MADAIWQWTARAVVDALKRGEVSPSEAVRASLDRIATVDPAVNAVPTVCAERALAHAARLEALPVEQRGSLAGLPVLIKDLVEVEGVRTTYGSPAFTDFVPTDSAHPVQRIEAAGGIVLGKTNTPEFGAGANTFNEVFGITRNPWNTALTCGGSSGGSAVALATGMAWLADGSDLGGSLRTPAAFCNVVGLRPSPGLVAQGPQTDIFQSLAVEGPMGRDVADTGLLLDVMAGFEADCPLTWPRDVTSFAAAATAPELPERIAFSVDLGGITPVEPTIATVVRDSMQRLASAGVRVEEATPDFGPAVETFTTLRALSYVTNLAPMLETHRRHLKPEVIWNIERGLAMNAAEIGRALRERTQLRLRVGRFLAEHGFLVCPTTIVPPFPVERRYVEEVQGHRFASYVDWLTIVFAITLSGCPVISIPCGRDPQGLPVGLQVVGPPRGEAALLRVAAAFEAVLGAKLERPIEPAVSAR